MFTRVETTSRDRSVRFRERLQRRTIDLGEQTGPALVAALAKGTVLQVDSKTNRSGFWRTLSRNCRRLCRPRGIVMSLMAVAAGRASRFQTLCVALLDLNLRFRMMGAA
jgi:hypothetical protein